MGNFTEGELRRYTKLFKEYGHDYRALKYGSEFKQKIRFHTVANALKNLGINSVLDVGCGFGDLLPFLVGEGFEVKRYKGIDLVPEFVEECRKKYGGTEAEFTRGTVFDVTEAFDAVIAISVFTVNELGAKQVLENSIVKMFELAKKVAVFTVITDNKKEKDAEDLVVNLSEFIGFCGSITEEITIDRRSIPYGATIALYRKSRESAL